MALDDEYSLASGILAAVRSERDLVAKQIVDGAPTNWDEYRFLRGKLVVLDRVEAVIQEEIGKWRNL